MRMAESVFDLSVMSGGAEREPVLKLYRYGSFWLIKPKACTNQKVVRDTSCLTRHGNQSVSECLLGGKIGKIGKIPGILRVYLKKPGYPHFCMVSPPGPHRQPLQLLKTPHTTFAYHYTIPLQN